jgi:hypothetical protein
LGLRLLVLLAQTVADLQLSQIVYFDRWKNAARRQPPLPEGFEAAGRFRDQRYRSTDWL